MTRKSGKSPTGAVRRAPPSKPPRTILAVDDDPDELELIVRALRDAARGEACEIVPLSGGIEALDYLFGSRPGAEQAAPVLVLLDLQMPKVGGIEVLRKMRADARMAMVPVVVFTSSDTSEDRRESHRAGCDSYVLKPDDPLRFAEVLHGIFRDRVVAHDPLPH